VAVSAGDPQRIGFPFGKDVEQEAPASLGGSLHIHGIVVRFDFAVISLVFPRPDELQSVAADQTDFPRVAHFIECIAHFLTLFQVHGVSVVSDSGVISNVYFPSSLRRMISSPTPVFFMSSAMWAHRSAHHSSGFFGFIVLG
jgi:hypothetical protein